MPSDKFSMSSPPVQANKFMVNSEYNAERSLDPIGEHTLLRAVIDETGQYLRNIFNNILWRRLTKSETSEEEKEEIYKLQDTLDFEPFAASDAAFLTLVVYGEYYGTLGEKVVVPWSVKMLWNQKIASRIPWLRQYVAVVEEVRNQSTQQLRGVGVTWDASALAVTLARSGFSLEVQAALRDREYRFIN